MKKILTLFALALSLLLVFAACDSGDSEGKTCQNGHTGGSFVESVAATCTEDGYVKYHCNDCGEDYTEPNGAKATGHSTSVGTYNNDHTCTKNGTESAFCGRCQQTVKTEVPNTARHEWDHDIYCKHCRTEEHITKNLKFTLNADGTGYIVSWDVVPFSVVEADIAAGTVRKEMEKIINIPAIYNGLPVVEIAAHAFDGGIYNSVYDYDNNTWGEGNADRESLWWRYNSLDAVEHIHIPASVKKIGEYAFYRTRTSVGAYVPAMTLTLSEGIEEIGTDAFRQSELTGKIVLPASLTSLGDGAFRYCNIEEVVFNCRNITVIPAYLFEGNPIRKVTIPSFVREIKNGAFASEELLTVIIESSDLTVSSGALGWNVNTVIDRSSAGYTLDQIKTWIPSSVNLALRESDPNKSITVTCTVLDNNYNANGVHIGTALFERDVTFYYSHLDGENILTDFDRSKIRGVLTELRIPEGITVIVQGTIDYLQCDRIVFPDSLKRMDQPYGLSPQTVSISKYTAPVSFSQITTVEYRESENCASINLSKVWDSLSADNEYTVTVDGVIFKFSVPGDTFSTNIGQKGVNNDGDKYVWFTNSGLRVDISFADENDARRAFYLGIRGNNATGSVNDGVLVSAYYFDEESASYQRVTTSYEQFDVDYDQFSWVDSAFEEDFGNGDWYFVLENTVSYGYKVSDIVIKFAQSYNDDLTAN